MSVNITINRSTSKSSDDSTNSMRVILILSIILSLVSICYSFISGILWHFIVFTLLNEITIPLIIVSVDLRSRIFMSSIHTAINLIGLYIIL